MKIKEVVATLERFAPLPLQESYDNAGLQIGLTEAESSGVLLCLDVTEDVLEEALSLGCNTVVSHHPLLFRALRRLTDESMVERCVRMAVKNDLSVYSAHTNLDNARGGVNFQMADLLGLEDVDFLRPAEGMDGGSGIVGRLAEPMPMERFLREVQDTFGVDCLFHNRTSKSQIASVAYCGGAGAFLLGDALRMGVDAFLTGEMGYHDYFGVEDDILIGVLGHYQSERYTMSLLRRILSEAHPTLPIYETTVNTNPIKYLY
ncbi:MAG: Nif3-like dinuclear metal center hexameric protein [Alloprevotella sp.]|nr:Nif3-like dinuclear metal center hexameric protein [Alloprevotella sp.]